LNFEHYWTPFILLKISNRELFEEKDFLHGQMKDSRRHFVVGLRHSWRISRPWKAAGEAQVCGQSEKEISGYNLNFNL